MKNEEVGTFWVIIGFILLPFIALYKLIKSTTEDMSDNQSFLFYFILFIIIIQLLSIINI